VRSTSRWLIVVSALALLACAPAAKGAAPGGSCQVTAAPAPAFVPPAPYPPQPPVGYTGRFWYGTADLWTMLRSGGTLAGFPQSTAGYFEKVFWWSAEYSVAREPVPALVVTGHRLDGQSAPLVADRPTNELADFGQAMLAGVTFPTAGCWEIAGQYRGHDLSFVAQVTP
jgi:hypothetical protein